MKARGYQDPGSADLQRLCQAVLQADSPAFRGAEIEASFHPYIGLTHTIRRKQNKWVVRISDHCRDAPQPALEAVVTILACKVLRKKPGRRALDAYQLFCRDPRVADAVRSRRIARGRKVIGLYDGRHHSLQQIYSEVNGRYFNNQVEIRAIGWGMRPGRNRLGHYDPVHHTITLSPALDSREIPKYAVSYIVYHEMLHAVFENASTEGRKRHHPPEFRRAERAYPGYAEAKKFLREFCRKPRGSMI